MGGAITSRSLDEASSWKAVGRFVQERLVKRLTTAKRMEADGLGVEIDLAANEAMGPKGVYPERTTRRLTVPASVLRRMKMSVPTGGACRSGCQAAGNGRRVGAASIRTAARVR